MIDKILQSIAVLQPLAGNSALIFALMVGLAFGFIVLSLTYLVTANVDPVRRRLFEGQAQDSNSGAFARKVDEAIEPFKSVILPSNDKEISSVRERLIHAGFRRPNALSVYYATKLLLILGLGVLGLVVAHMVFKTTITQSWFFAVSGSLFGLIAPSYWLDKKAKARQREIVNGFPDVLDLLVACTEAGLGINDAIHRVARESYTMYPVLGMELETVNSEVRAGRDRVEAFRGLATRTGVDEISGFVAMITQSIRFGTSIAETMRVYAEEFRDKRMQRAEEQAAKVGTKLIFPLVLCIFPSFFVVSIGPATLSIIRVLQHTQL